ncbi:hypothetical protein NPIL_627961 [Nephila pilipes]|uniref:Uncharacterized protein n=1 Tax=Nephila pilipes TaxID=299642 RepID=A0A8X6PFD0_NEPPI|nr:hypothetical protein NPIL_627961 [Nephila pilipes]
MKENRAIGVMSSLKNEWRIGFSSELATDILCCRNTLLCALSQYMSGEWFISNGFFLTSGQETGHSGNIEGRYEGSCPVSKKKKRMEFGCRDMWLPWGWAMQKGEAPLL